MRILTLNANLKGVGTYQRCFYFSRELARAGHEVTMATVSRHSRYSTSRYYKRDWLGKHDRPEGSGPWVRMIEGPNLGYKWLPGWGSGPLDILARTREIISNKYDLIYGFEYQPNVSWPVYWTRRFQSYCFFSDWCDWHAGQSNRLRGWKLAQRFDAYLEERIRRIATKVTVISKVLRERAILIGVPENQVEYVPQGTDTDYVKPEPAEEMRKLLGLPAKRPVVLAVVDGDMTRVVRTYGSLMKQRPDVLGIIIGNSGAEEQREAERLGIRDRILWTGWVSDENYPRYLAAADVLLFPLEELLLNYARFPGKVLDYFSAGRPVVSNAVGEVGKLIREQQIGLTTELDSEAMARAVEQLLDDERLRRDMGERARSVMVQQWKWDLRGEKIGALVGSFA